MADPLGIAAQLLSPAFARVADAPDIDPVVRTSDHADAQANGALDVARRLGRNPRQVAGEILAATDANPVASLDVAGPGFINVTFRGPFLDEQMTLMSQDSRLGVQLPTTLETVVIDYSAPNVAKEMHVGHLRTTVIGDALARLYGFDGHRVIRENHIGDWGTPFGMLIEHLIDEAGTATVADFAVGDLDAFYKQGRCPFSLNLGHIY